MDKSLITVTSPLLPDLDDFHAMLKEIWASKWITNNGSFHKQLEKELAAYLKVPFISLFHQWNTAIDNSFAGFENNGRGDNHPL